jgi:uncharacterized membrane protein YkvA (DUF1232 family)
VDEEKMASEFDRLRAEAEEALKDGAKVRTTIGKVFAKLGRTVAKPIVFILDDILMLLAALAAAVTGKYTKFPVVTLAMILAALGYFLLPLDVVCDWLPFIGYLDDVFVFTLVLKMCHSELQAFKAWENENAQANAQTVAEEEPLETAEGAAA